MHFRAKLRRATSIHNDWTGASRIGGTINGVKFHRLGLNDFVSVEDPLPADAVTALLNHHMVDLEVSTTPVQSATVTVLAGWHPGPGEQIKTGADDPPPAAVASGMQIPIDHPVNLESLLADHSEEEVQAVSTSLADELAALRRREPPTKEPLVTRPRGRPPNSSRHQ